MQLLQFYKVVKAYTEVYFYLNMKQYCTSFKCTSVIDNAFTCQ